MPFSGVAVARKVSGSPVEKFQNMAGGGWEMLLCFGVAKMGFEAERVNSWRVSIHHLLVSNAGLYRKC